MTSSSFEGFQQARGYRLRRDEDDPGEPLRRMQPRALIVPPELQPGPEDIPNLDALIIEDGAPVDSILSEKQMRLLTEPSCGISSDLLPWTPATDG